MIEVTIKDIDGIVHKLTKREIYELRNCVACTDNEGCFGDDDSGEKLKKVLPSAYVGFEDEREEDIRPYQKF